MPEDLDIELIKARKLKEMREHALAMERSKAKETQKETLTEKDMLKKCLYDRGGEVLDMAESQFPYQTKILITKLISLIRSGDLKDRISGGELLALFRSLGLNIRLKTNINISDHGKIFSISEKLKEKE